MTRASVLQAYDNRQEKQVIQGLTAGGILAYTINSRTEDTCLAHRKPQFSKSC